MRSRRRGGGNADAYRLFIASKGHDECRAFGALSRMAAGEDIGEDRDCDAMEAKMSRMLLIYNWLLAPIPGACAMRLKIWWLRKCGVALGMNTTIEPFVRFELVNSTLEIGDGAKISSGALFQLIDATVKIGHSATVRSFALIHVVGNSAVVGNNVCIAENVLLESIRSNDTGGCLKIGSHVDVMQFTFLSANGKAKVSVGNHCRIAHNVSIKATHHAICHCGDCIGGDSLFDDIMVKDGCWICAGATIIPGVVIG